MGFSQLRLFSPTLSQPGESNSRSACSEKLPKKPTRTYFSADEHTNTHTHTHGRCTKGHDLQISLVLFCSTLSVCMYVRCCRRFPFSAHIRHRLSADLAVGLLDLAHLSILPPNSNAGIKEIGAKRAIAGTSATSSCSFRRHVDKCISDMYI